MNKMQLDVDLVKQSLENFEKQEKPEKFEECIEQENDKFPVDIKLISLNKNYIIGKTIKETIIKNDVIF